MRRRLAAGALVLVAGFTSLLTGVSEADPSGRPSGSTAGEPASVPGELVVGYRPGVPETRRSEIRGRARAQRIRGVAEESGRRPGVELVKVDGIDRAEAARRLRSDPDVVYAEPNWIYTHDATSNDPRYLDGSLWGMTGDTTAPPNPFGSQADEAWAAGKTGSSTVYVGIIDEGYQYTHPDLAANAGTNPGETGAVNSTDGKDNDGNGYVDDVYGWDFAGNNKTVYDGTVDDHGTHVAGTIGAKGNNGVGVAGVNWDVRFISAKFLGANGGTTANAVKAIDYITDLKTRHGLNIVATNNSWSGGGYSQALADAIGRANDANIVFVAAAGNSGVNSDVTAVYPSGYNLPNVISVAAIDKNGARASWSNYGATSVDLGAPGVGIWSTVPTNAYAAYDGTSMATPHVTGAIALYAASNPITNVVGIRSALLGSVMATPALAGVTVTGGRLDIGALVGGVAVPPPPPPPPPPPNPRSVTVTKGNKTWTGTPITVRWSGYTVQVDIYRNGSKVANKTTNDGLFTQTVRGSGRMTYLVCDTGKTTGSSCAEGFTDI